jgi:FkbM family methyltransferase
MMVFRRLQNFLRKTPSQQAETLGYFTRRGLSNLPFVPLPVRLSVPPAGKVVFWWSYVEPTFHPERGLLDYWGKDVGGLRFLWRFLRSGMTFLDVGAYHGVYALVAATRVGCRGRVVAFEPSPRDRRRLALHLRMNRLGWVAVEPYAVGAATGKQRFFVALGDPTMNSLRRPLAAGPVQEVLVDVTTLDDYYARNALPPPDLIKLDVEGGELEVFDGAQGLMSSSRPVLICELLDLVTEPWGYPARNILARLKQAEYEWYDFREDGTITPHREQENYPDVSNYLAVPREKRNLVADWVRVLESAAPAETLGREQGNG